MIAHINGRLIFRSPESVVVDVGGVGYEVCIPLSTYYRLPDLNETVALNTVTFIKDDTIQLYGFLTVEEKDLFMMLISVSGVGPRLARNILSGTSVDELVSIIAGGDVAALKRLPGIGKKTAERVILEIKDKVGPSRKTEALEAAGMPQMDSTVSDVVSALKNLGYRTADAEDAAQRAKKGCPEGAGFEDLFKAALRMLSKR